MHGTFRPVFFLLEAETYYRIALGLPWPSTAWTQTSGRSNLASLVTLDVLKLFDGFGSSIKRTRFRPNHPVSLWLLGAIRANLCHRFMWRNQTLMATIQPRSPGCTADEMPFRPTSPSLGPHLQVTTASGHLNHVVRSPGSTNSSWTSSGQRSCPLAATAGSRRCSFFHR